MVRSPVRKVSKHPGISPGMLKLLSTFSIVALLIGGLLIFNSLIKTGGISSHGIPAGQDTPSLPQKIVIPKIGVDAVVSRIALQADKSLEVPGDPDEVGWYIYSPAPGEEGPAIMVGHLDSAFGPAVFSRLGELAEGDEIKITRDNGETVSFQVEKMEKYVQDDFPTENVYGDIDYPGLRLITCFGKYLRFRGRYTHNLVVYAALQQ